MSPTDERAPVTDPFSGPEDRLETLAVVLDRVLRRAVPERSDREDIVQEALARTLEARPRLADDVLGPYAMTVARNLAAGLRSREAVRLRNRSRLYDPRETPNPAETTVRRESDAAVRAAVAALPEAERAVLVGHVVDEQDTAMLAELVGSTPGGVAARLARARARARVDYVLALRGQRLPSEACRPVLVAVSGADRRRQDALGAARHLAGCPVCPTLVQPLAERSSALAGLVPIPVLVAAARFRADGRSQATAAAGTAVLAGGVAAALLLGGAGQHPDGPADTSLAGSDPVATSSAGLDLAPPPAASAAAPSATHPAAPARGAHGATVTDPGAGSRRRNGRRRETRRHGHNRLRVVTDVGAPYGFRITAAGRDYYVVFSGLPAHRVEVGNHVRLAATLTPMSRAVLEDPETVEASERTSVARLRRYLSTTGPRIVFEPGP